MAAQATSQIFEQCTIHDIFQRRFPKFLHIPSGTLRHHVLVAKYSVGCLGTVKTRHLRSLSEEMEVYLYKLMGMRMCKALPCDDKVMLRLLFKEYHNADPTKKDSMGKYVSWMRTGLRRKYEREKKIIVLANSYH